MLCILHRPRRQRRQEFSGKPRKTAEFGNSNLWFPNSSIEPAAAGGSRPSRPCPRRQRRQEFSGKPRKTAEFGNSNLWFPNSSIEPAAASGCRLSLPAASGCRPCRPAASGCRLSLRHRRRPFTSLTRESMTWVLIESTPGSASSTSLIRRSSSSWSAATACTCRRQAPVTR